MKKKKVKQGKSLKINEDLHTRLKVHTAAIKQPIIEFVEKAIEFQINKNQIK